MTLAVIPALGKSIGGRHMLWMDTALKVSLVRMHSAAYYATFLRTFSVLKYVFIIKILLSGFQCTAQRGRRGHVD